MNYLSLVNANPSGQGGECLMLKFRHQYQKATGNNLG